MARDLVNLPGNMLQVEDISRAALDLVQGGYEVRVFGKEEIEALGMGGLLAVNKGSQHPRLLPYWNTTRQEKPPELSRLSARALPSTEEFPKPSEGMPGEMKSDMAGAAGYRRH